MKKVRLWLLVLALVVCGVLAAGTVQRVGAEETGKRDVLSAEEEAIGEWMMNFYRLAPETFIPMMRRMVKAELFPGNPVRMERVAFVSEAFRAHPDKVVEWCKGLSRLKVEPKRVVGWAVRNAELENEEECLAALKLSKKWEKAVREAERLPFDRLEPSPLALDVWWAQFFASGNSMAAMRVINQLAPENSSQKPDAVLSKAAQWSTFSNALSHKKIRELIAARAKTAKGPLKKAIAEMQAALEKEFKAREEALRSQERKKKEKAEKGKSSESKKSDVPGKSEERTKPKPTPKPTTPVVKPDRNTV